MNKHLVSPVNGTFLASGKRQGSVIKRAMICRTGEFWGMNGPVTVTRQMLEGISEKYRTEKSEPQNDNDFAPILIDHVRVADNVMGRLLADGMEVGTWTAPDGQQCYGLFADLRVDDEEARSNVETGKFAQLSISFDEESYDLYEVSFVAVPAAQGSIILSKGGKTVPNFQQKLSRAQQKHQALAAAVRERRGKRKAILGRIQTAKSSALKDAAAIGKILDNLSATLKAGQLKARFQEFVKQGKMDPIELSEMNFKELAGLGDKSIKALAASYERRPTSEDTYMHGQTSEEIRFTADLSPAKMREAMALQRAGKGSRSLSALAEEVIDDKKLGDDEDDAKKLGEEEGGEKKQFALAEEDHKAVMDMLMDAHGKMGACLEKFKAIGADSDKLAEADKDEEKQLGDEDDDTDMSDDEDDSKKLGDEDDEKNPKLGDDDESEKEEKEGAK